MLSCLLPPFLYRVQFTLSSHSRGRGLAANTLVYACVRKVMNMLAASRPVRNARWRDHPLSPAETHAQGALGLGREEAIDGQGEDGRENGARAHLERVFQVQAQQEDKEQQERVVDNADGRVAQAQAPDASV